MAKSRYNPPSKAEAIKHHVARHNEHYERHFKHAAKGAPPPEDPNHQQAMQQAMQAAQAATAQDMAAPEGGAPTAPAGAPGSGVAAPV